MSAHQGGEFRSLLSVWYRHLWNFFLCVSTELQNPRLVLKKVLFLIARKHYPISRSLQSFTELGKHTPLIWKGWLCTESGAAFPSCPAAGASSSHTPTMKHLQRVSSSHTVWGKAAAAAALCIWQTLAVARVPLCCTKTNPCSQLLQSHHGKQISSWQGKRKSLSNT